MLARNFLTTTLSSIIAMALSFVASVMLARILGAEQRGIYALAVLIPTTIYSLGTFGLSTANIIYAGKYPEKRGVIAFQSLAFASVIGLLTLGFYAYALTARPGWFERFQVVGTSNLILASFFVFLQLTWFYLRSGIQGANRIPMINIGTIVLPLSRILLIAILVGCLKLGVTGGILAQLGCLTFMVLFMAVATATKVPIGTWRPDFVFFKKAFSLGVKVHLNHIALFVTHMIDRYMIAYIIPDSDRALGHYAIAAQFTILMWGLPHSLQTILLPHLSVTKSNKITLTAKIARILFLTLSPMFIIFTAAAPLIKVILGQDYTDSILPFVLLLPGIFLLGSSRPMDSYLLHIEKPIYTIVISWVGALTNVAFNFYFIPQMGIAGAALASTLSHAIMAVVTVGCFKVETHLPLGELIPKPSDFAEIVKRVAVGLDKLRIKPLS